MRETRVFLFVFLRKLLRFFSVSYSVYSQYDFPFLSSSFMVEWTAAEPKKKKQNFAYLYWKKSEYLSVIRQESRTAMKAATDFNLLKKKRTTLSGGTMLSFRFLFYLFSKVNNCVTAIEISILNIALQSKIWCRRNLFFIPFYLWNVSSWFPRNCYQTPKGFLARIIPAEKNHSP